MSLDTPCSSATRRLQTENVNADRQMLCNEDGVSLKFGYGVLRHESDYLMLMGRVALYGKACSGPEGFFWALIKLGGLTLSNCIQDFLKIQCHYLLIRFISDGFISQSTKVW